MTKVPISFLTVAEISHLKTDQNAIVHLGAPAHSMGACGGC